MTKQTEKQQMVEYFNAENYRGENELFYVGVQLQGADTTELIINHVDVLEEKLEYYSDTYNKHLVHKSTPVSIVDYGYIPLGSRVHDELLILTKDEIK